jgi:hypothetical protein
VHNRENYDAHLIYGWMGWTNGWSSESDPSDLLKPNGAFFGLAYDVSAAKRKVRSRL